MFSGGVGIQVYLVFRFGGLGPSGGYWGVGERIKNVFISRILFCLRDDS